MEKTNFRLKVDKKEKGLRLDQYIIKNLDCPISRCRIQQLIKTGKITVNEKPTKAHYRVKENDTLSITIVPAQRPVAEAEQIALNIIFEDEDILVVDKPENMVTHPGLGNYTQTLVNALLGYGCPLSTVNGPTRPGIVHRLDKDTSGLMVIAKNNFAHQKLAAQFQKHTVQRTYVAIVKGRVEHNEGVIDYPLARHPHHRQQFTVSYVKSRTARTKFKVLKRYGDVSLLELSPHTGRTHQLRVHLKFLGHPILGDWRYGKASDFERMALHATVLGFRHPKSDEFVQFRSDVPQSFIRYLENLQ